MWSTMDRVKDRVSELPGWGFDDKMTGAALDESSESKTISPA